MIQTFLPFPPDPQHHVFGSGGSCRARVLLQILQEGWLDLIHDLLTSESGQAPVSSWAPILSLELSWVCTCPWSIPAPLSAASALVPDFEACLGSAVSHVPCLLPEAGGLALTSRWHRGTFVRLEPSASDTSLFSPGGRPRVPGHAGLGGLSGRGCPGPPSRHPARSPLSWGLTPPESLREMWTLH